MPQFKRQNKRGKTYKFAFETFERQRVSTTKGKAQDKEAKMFATHMLDKRLISPK